MVKVIRPSKKTKTKQQAKKAGKKMLRRARSMPPLASVGAISTIDTAPVAIGNSIKGAASQVVQVKNGVIVRSRDFMFPAIGSGSVTTWTLVGGSPLSPAVFTDSTLRNYMQMYQKFRWRRLIVHYITSSSTSSTGDVMFYHNKNRESVFLNQTSTQLLPFVLNDDDTVIGPQWTNHSAQLHVQGEWKSTDYGMTSELEQYADGDLFLLSKTSTTDSPGYVLFDYEVEFAELQISPRLLSLPLARAQWTNLSIATQTGAVSPGTTILFTATGTNIAGVSGAIPSGLANGDVYKVIIDVTNTSVTWAFSAGSINVNTFMRVPTSNSGYTPFTVQDGTTLYCVYNGANFIFYANPEAAYVEQNPIAFNASATITTFGLMAWMSLIGTVNSVNINPNY